MKCVAKDLLGKKFGRLTVISRAGSDKYKKAVWICRCECGNEIKVNTHSLTTGNTKSCGCYKHDVIVETKTKHGHRHSKLYDIYYSMLRRCYNSNDKHYEYYGGSGIDVCDCWNKSFDSFFDWSMKNGYKECLTIDRIDNSKGYSPENCRWTDMKEQGRNKRNNIVYKGKCLATWCEELGLKYNTIKRRLYRGWSWEKALGETA